MQILDYLYKLPETKDPSGGANGWFAALAYNISRLATHNHDGTTAAKINIKNLTKQHQTIDSEDWGADLGGSRYRQTITVPEGLTLDDVSMRFIDGSGNVVYPTIQNTSDTSYTIDVNDDSLTLTVIYG